MTQTERHHAVAVDHRRPAVGVDVEEFHAVLVGTGVVDQQADVEIRGRGGKLGAGIEPAQVERDDARLDAGCLADLLRERVERIGATRHEHDVHAPRRDLTRERRARSLGRARDDRPRTVAVAKVSHPLTLRGAAPRPRSAPTFPTS